MELYFLKLYFLNYTSKNLFQNFQWLVHPQPLTPVKFTILRLKGLVPGVNFCFSEKKIKKSGYFFAAEVETIL